ncbi:hypothetical protein [Thermus thermophilus]|uniref:Uncharacterized protein n=3 Tax=Thermus thermophilus TaxID=274 RepID=Q93R94_THETH|nr:hypothetical protein [Thermus thermophilus]AAS81734.1 hypothetical protein TT_C1392 [Thermus thermophilus HB27]QMV31445.1 hypothetical protein HB27c_C1432 [Thermus thermophilus]WMV94834.1 hypothetical protein RB649_07105 [Thermus thermophilus HB27]BAB61774.1 hypothetical protein [Thermus thermophilus]
MQRWSALFLLLGLAQAQGFFGLGAVDGNVFGFGQAFPAGLWWRVGVDHNLEGSAYLYLRRGGVVDPLLGALGLGFPGAYYLGLGVEGGPSGARPSGLLGLEAFLGEGFAIFLEGMGPVYIAGGAHFGIGLRYYPSGREAFTPLLDPERRFRLYVPIPTGRPVVTALAYEGEGYALWLGGWGFGVFGALWPALGAHAYLGDAFFGLGTGYRPGDAWVAFPYLGYRFRLGEGVEAQLRLQTPFRVSAERGLEDFFGLVPNLLDLTLGFPL